ncbi:MAG: helix-turn-helix domain-containing protein [Eubacterium sp.]|nr:helix-turn-helix domain-containing protein [Eubacterium sp.]
MKESIIQKIFDLDNEHIQLLNQKAMELYGVDMTDAESIHAFLRNIPNFQLPNLYLQLGNSRDIYISHHSLVFNHLEHSHDFFEMVYVEKGTVVDRIDGHDIVLNRGDICIHNPNAKHEIASCGEEDLLLNILISRETFQGFVFHNIIRDKGLEGFFDEVLQDNSPNYLEFHHLSAQIDSLVEMLFEEYYSEQKSEMMLNATLLLLFGNLLRLYHENKKSDEVFEYLNAHLAEVTLESAAAYFRYHPKYFSALLKKKTGKSFKALLIELRLRRATYYLKYTDLSVEEIADSIGYKDASSFYAKFQNAYHLTPNQYRLKN